MIYLDNAATTLQKPPEVMHAMIETMGRCGNAARGAHGNALDAARHIYETRVQLARFFGCSSPNRVVFTANSTEALNIAIFGTIQPGDHVISTDLEHNSVLRPLYALEEEKGVQLDFVHASPLGTVNYGDFEAAIRPNTRAIVCTHGSNLTGQVLDIGRIGAITKRYGLLLIVDASQTAGSLPIDTEAMGVDILCFTGHKGLFGPQGTGGLCIGPGVEIAPWKYGGSGVQSHNRRQPMEYPTRLEAGTLNGPGIAGLRAGITFIQSVGLQEIQNQENRLMRRFYEGIRAMDGVTVYGDYRDDVRCPIVSLNIGTLDSGEAADMLWDNWQIAVRSGAHCAPRMHNALGTTRQGAVRFSFSWFNTQEQVDAAIAAVAEIAAEERKGNL